ncbi:MAG TPA: nitroreductase family protein [bacterium]|nr:nitroreductase family protein [bacterium]HOL35458.1 nitroreductase family protein [bacterium]HPP07746.1 nitroreductase family protein [bacterium]
MKKFLVLCLLIGVVIVFAGENEIQPVNLPKPQITGGKPLMEALSARKSMREFSSNELSNQTISNLLWAAFGINRPDSGKRTAPSASNWQEIDIYVATPKAVYVYDAKTNILKPVISGDFRANFGRQAFVKTAPVVLAYVADYSKMGRASQSDKDFYSAVDTGFISQNVYLFCASEGLNTVVLGIVDRENLAKILNLKVEQKIILTQPVGYPKK